MNDAHLPRLPKIPFIAADAILIITALLIAYSGEGPLSPLTFFWIILCVALGGILACLPFYAEFRDHVRLAEYDKSQANLENARRIEAALVEIQQIQEAVSAQTTHAERTAQLIENLLQRTDSRLATLDSLQFPEPPPPPPPAEPAPLPPELALQLTAILQQLEKIQLAPPPAPLPENEDMAELASLEPDRQETPEPAQDEPLIEDDWQEEQDEDEGPARDDDTFDDDESASLDEVSEEDETEDESEPGDDEQPWVESDEQEEFEEDEDDEEDEDEEEEDLNKDGEEPESQPEEEEDKKDQPIASDDPEGAWDEDWPVEDLDTPEQAEAPTATSEPEEEEPEPAEEEPTQPKPAAIQPDLMPDLPEGSERAKKPGRKETALIAQVLIGIGNKPYVRGQGPGLSPDKGVPMEFLEIGKWQWVAPEGNEPITCQLYKNDETPAEGEPITLEPGQRRTISPRFP